MREAVRDDEVEVTVPVEVTLQEEASKLLGHKLGGVERGASKSADSRRDGDRNERYEQGRQHIVWAAR